VTMTILFLCKLLKEYLFYYFCKGFLGDEVVSKAAAPDIQTKKRLVTLFLLFSKSSYREHKTRIL